MSSHPLFRRPWRGNPDKYLKHFSNSSHCTHLSLPLVHPITPITRLPPSPIFVTKALYAIISFTFSYTIYTTHIIQVLMLENYTVKNLFLQCMVLRKDGYFGSQSHSSYGSRGAKISFQQSCESRRRQTFSSTSRPGFREIWKVSALSRTLTR